MKLLFMIEYSHPGVLGGDATFGRNLKKIFPDNLFFLANKRHDEIYFDLENVTEIYSKSKIFKRIDRLFKGHLKKYITSQNIRKINPDICILNHPKSIDLMLNIKSKKILVQHTNFETFLSAFCQNDLKLIERLKEELDMFVFLSEYDRKRFVKELNFSIEKTTVIRHTSEIDILEKPKIKNKNLVMIARLHNKTKRFDLVIDFMRRLPEFTLNIYGDGIDKEFLEDLIKKKKLQNVILHGGTNQVKEKLDEAGIFIMTSDFEGYPITLIEAMRRGLPIILRNTFDAAPDIVQNNGILLNKEWNEDKFLEGINKIYNNYDYFSKNSTEMGKKYNFDIIKEQWLNLINKI